MEKLKSNFKPLAPDGHQSVGTVYMGESTTELLPHIVVAQWLADKAAGRDTLVVLGSGLERSFLTEDLKKEQVLAAEEIGTSLPEPSGSDKGGRLSLLLPNAITTTFLDWYAVGKKAGQLCPFNSCSTIIFNLGWGNVQFSTAMCLAGVCTVINEAADTGRRSELLLCVIRDGHHKDSSSPGAQTLSSAPLGKPTVTWHKLDDHKQDLKDTFQTMSGRRVVLTDVYYLADSIDQSIDKMEEYCAFIGPAAISTLPQVRQEDKYLLLSEDMTYLGPVSELGHVMVHPYTSTWMYDEDSGHVVHQEKALRSQAEIRHIMGLRGTDGAIPRVDCFMSEVEFGNLPETRPPSYSTIELDKLLLACIGLEVRQFAKLFLEVPNYKVITEQVRQLKHRKLIKESTGDKSLLFDAYELTRFGTAAFGLIRTTDIESFATITVLAEVCCLKGAPEVEGRRDTSAILDAMTSLAVILSTREHVSLIPLVLLNVDEQYLDSDEQYRQYIGENLCGVAAPLQWRGPIWFAIAIWHVLRLQKDFRSTDRVSYQRLDGEAIPTSSILFWAVHVDLLESFAWDDALDAAATGCGFTRQEKGLIGDELHSLSPSDLLFVEKAMVRALLDKLAWVMYPRQDGLPFAYDLFSHRELQEPEDDSLRILDPERCMQDRAVEPPSVDDPSEFFCVYTGIQRRETEEGVLQWVPSNVTYVSAHAVREVLEEVEKIHPSQDIFSVARKLAFVG